MELGAMATGRSERKTQMHLDRVSIEAADGGGYIVRCSFEGKDKEGHTQWEEKTKVFLRKTKLAGFLEEVLDDWDGEEDY